METFIPIIALVALLTGIALTIIALKYRTEKHLPILSWNPRNWRLIWNMKDCFNPPGYTLHITGWTIVFLTMILYSYRHWGK